MSDQESGGSIDTHVTNFSDAVMIVKSRKWFSDLARICSKRVQHLSGRSRNAPVHLGDESKTFKVRLKFWAAESTQTESVCPKPLLL